MIDLTCQRFFTQPKHPLQRQYEALRSVFVGRRSQKEVAEEFGYRYTTRRDSWSANFEEQVKRRTTNPHPLFRLIHNGLFVSNSTIESTQMR